MRARARVAQQLWRADGARKLPPLALFDEAVTALPRGELEWICELSPLGPLYLLPTRNWIRALARYVSELRPRRIVEVAAGDGFLSNALRPHLRGVEIIATDSGAWSKPQARMSPGERRRLRSVDVPGLQLGPDVRRIEAKRALRELRPDVVLAAWLPPGSLLDGLIRAPVRYVVDIGAAGGVTAGAWSWRYAHELVEGPVETLARCRLDERPSRALHSRVTLYYGARHREHALERVRPGDWLWQFKP